MSTDDNPARCITLRQPSDVRATRNEIRRIAEKLPFDNRQIADILLAACEACMNGVRYGVPTSGGAAVTVRTCIGDDYLSIEVEDKGEGFSLAPAKMPDPSSESGRGIALMHALMDQVRIESSASGTRVWMMKRYARSEATERKGNGMRAGWLAA